MEDVYVMECGCKLSKDELVVVKNGRRCPVHLEKVDRIIRECPDCGKMLNLSALQWPKLRCDECRSKRRVKVHKESCASYRKKKKNEPYQIGINKSEKACGERWDCAHRSACIDDAIKSGKGNVMLPCYGCDRYERHMAVI